MTSTAKFELQTLRSMGTGVLLLFGSMLAMRIVVGGLVEIDPEWLYWILGVITAAIVGAVELSRSRHVGVPEFASIMERLGNIEGKIPNDLADRLGKLEGMTPDRLSERLAILEHQIGGEGSGEES